MSENHERWEQAFKASPKAYKSPEGPLMMSFTLTENTDTILPMFPSTMYRVQGQTVRDIRIGFFSLSEDKVLGQLPYGDAAAVLGAYAVEARNPYVLIRGLSNDELHEVIEKGKAEAVRRDRAAQIGAACRQFAELDHTDPETVSRVFAASTVKTVRFEDIPFPSGIVTAGDPFVSLRDLPSVGYLNEEIHAGNCPLELAIAGSEVTGQKAAGMRLKISGRNAHTYRPVQFAEKKDGILIDLKDSFFAMTGYICFMDREAVQAWNAFAGAWSEEHPYQDIISGYFQPLFTQEGFIRFRIPGTGYDIVIAYAGFGKGWYRVFGGYDENDTLCEFVSLFADPALMQ
ncbi:MAG: DUF4241 domain-containing protein [Solobacterium sp.]|nr:DUF4241 domain-containing protein [Solobacterium sp.]